MERLTEEQLLIAWTDSVMTARRKRNSYAPDSMGSRFSPNIPPEVTHRLYYEKKLPLDEFAAAIGMAPPTVLKHLLITRKKRVAALSEADYWALVERVRIGGYLSRDEPVIAIQMAITHDLDVPGKYAYKLMRAAQKRSGG